MSSVVKQLTADKRRKTRWLVAACQSAVQWDQSLTTTTPSSVYNNHIDIQCEPKKSPLRFLTFFLKWLGIFSPNFTHPLYVPNYARLQIFIQLSPTVTKLCHIKRNHPVHIICSKCPPSAETHSGWSHLIWHINLINLNQGSANFLGSRAAWAPKELAAGRTAKFYVKNLITVD